MSSEVAIKVENLSKCYQIYENPRDRLKQFLLPSLRSVIGLSVRKYHREFWAVKDVSFEVYRGQTVGIIGRNGSGKSTLLQMLCGTLSPTAGSITTNGRIAALLELGAGFNPEFTGRENVYLNGAVLGLTRSELDARFDDIAAFADIGEFIESPVKTYSSGMYVRLAFAVQAMVDPDILIVDEALAVGDEKFQRKCFAQLEKLKSEGASILFVSHSAGSIVELCEKTLLLDHGKRLMFTPSPEAVRTYQKLLYASADTQERLILELLAEDSGGAKKDDCRNVLNEDGLDQKKIGEASHVPLNDAFDSGLVPETTIVYPSQGAVIECIKIVNDSGQVVNVLQSDGCYSFEVTGRFLSDFKGIYFGIHIKSVSGIEITGQRFPEEGMYLEDATSEKVFNMRFSFRVSLLPGVYFAGGGVWSSEEPVCAHRIIDAVMFRVAKSKKSESFGYVDLQATAPVFRMES